MSQGSDGQPGLAPVQSELLCFVADKSKVMAVDDIVKICSDFYSKEEILTTRQLLEAHGSRMSKRQGAGKLHTTVQDIVVVM